VGHIGRIFSLAFSPDSKTLASGSTDKNIILWDVDTGKRRDQSQLVGHVDGVYSLAFSPKPTGALLASGNGDGTVTLWDVPPTKWLGRPVVYAESLPRTQVMSVAFTRNGKTLASGGSDLVLWEVSTGEKRSVAVPFGSTAESVAFSPDDKTLAAGSMNNDISLWDVETMKPPRPPLKGHTDWVSSVAFSPDGKTLASGSADKTTVLWNVSTGQREILPLNHTEIVSSVVFSPDGKILASGSWDDTIILWDIDNHKILYTLENGPEDGAVYSLAFSPNGRTLASGNDDSISFWNTSNGQRSGSTLHKHGGAVKSVAYSFDGRMLASASDDKTIILWDTATNSPLGSPLRESNAPVYSVAFSPDGKLLASGGAMAEARDNWPLILWDMDFESWERRACEIVNRNFIDTSDQKEWSQYFPNQDYRATCAIGAIREADADAMKQDDKKASAAFSQAVTIGLHSSDAAINNRICWYGSIDGFPSVVKPACDRAVALAATTDDKNNFGDSRGVALAMTGHYDEAIQAFERFVKWSQDRNDLKESRRRRETWIQELQAGRNPIDQKTRRELRVE
jgi:WD40 repeat protein